MNLYLILLSLAYQCDFSQNIEIGTNNIDMNLNAGETLCLNSTTFPWFLIFPEGISDDFTFTKYETNIPSVDLITIPKFSGTSSNVIVFNQTFSSASFTAKSTSTLSFYSFLWPGVCQQGIYFTNSPKESLNISTISPFINISSHDDRCVLFIDNGNQIFNISMNSSSNNDHLYIYSNLQTIIKTFSKNNEDSMSLSSPGFFPLARFVTSTGQFHSLSLNFQSSSQTPQTLIQSNEEFWKRPVQCQNKDFWYSKDLAITLIVLISFLLLFLILFFLSKYDIIKTVLIYEH